MRPFLEEQNRLGVALKETQEGLVKTNKKFRAYKQEIGRTNVQLQNLFGVLSYSDPGAVGWLRNLTTNLDETDPTGLAKSSFVGVSYGAGVASQGVVPPGK